MQKITCCDNLPYTTDPITMAVPMKNVERVAAIMPKFFILIHLVIDLNIVIS